MSAPATLTLEATSGKARAGTLHTHHGVLQTPFFMTVGTLAAVKGLTPPMLREAGTQIVLANTYHLALRPGEALVKEMGGLAAFMGWHGPTLTDSGGYQVYSLAGMRKITDEGVRFRSHIDGAEFFLTPERAVQIQQDLGADFFMAFDECPPGGADAETVARSLARTHAWAARCREAWNPDRGQALFGIVQGGIHPALRRESAEAIAALDFPGNAIGGVSVGEAPEDVERIVAETTAWLPHEKARYLMGVGRPEDLLRAIGHGVDMFDCVMPTRHARHAEVFTRDGKMKLRNRQWQHDPRPIEEACDCATCRTVSRAYLRHLFVTGEMLGPIYAAIHNVRFYNRLMEEARAAILEDRYATYAHDALARLAGSTLPA